MNNPDEVLARIASIRENEAERRGLLRALEHCAKLAKLGIIRHDIVKRRRVVRYSNGRGTPTGKADIIMRDGTKHSVPDDLFDWKE